MKNKTALIKQILVVFALMVATISITSVLPIANAATDMIGAEDNPTLIANRTGGENDLKSLVLTIVNYFLTFLGILAVIMVIYGGVTYVSSAGNDEAVGKAKKIIMYALVGIVIILLSFVVVNAVLGAATGK